MADDVKDISIYTGSEWTSLSELAAGVVDAKLPIESVDGTVVLSDSSGSFVVSIGTQTRLKSGSTIPLSVNSGVSTGGATLQKWLYTNNPANQDKFNMGLQQAVGSGTVSYAFVVTDNGVTSEALRIGKDEITVPSQVQTSTVKGLVGTDASVTLGDQVTLKKGDGSEYVPSDSASIATRKYVDDNSAPTYDDTQIKADLNAEALARAAADTTLQANIDAKIWVGTTASYNNVNPKLPGTLYCLTD